MTADVTIRRYRPTDRNPVWRVHDESLRNSAMNFSAEYNRYLRHVPRAFLGTGGEFLVATVDPGDGSGRRAVGIGGYQPLPHLAETGTDDYPPVAEPIESTVRVRSVAVLPAFQSAGVGTALMAELESRAADAGFYRIVLKTTESLVPARRFYESLGYEPAGEAADDGSAETHLWYWRDL